MASIHDLGLQGDTIQVTRTTVREVFLDINTSTCRIQVGLSNEEARKVVEDIISLLGIVVTLPVGKRP